VEQQMNKLKSAHLHWRDMMTSLVPPIGNTTNCERSNVTDKLTKVELNKDVVLTAEYRAQ